MLPDDDIVIDVDDALDQLTELIVIPGGSPVHAVRRAIVLAPPPRPSLIVMPEDAALEQPNSVPCARVGKRSGARSMRLTPFATWPRLRDQSAH